MSDSLVITETERLIIRQLTEGDVTPLSQILADPEVMRYSVRGVMSVEQTQEFVDWCAERYSSRGFGPWGLELKQSSEFLGFAGLSTYEIDGVECIEMGYRLAPAYWGDGLATEAAAQILEYGFTELDLPSIGVIILPEHVASRRVAEKIGFSTFSVTEYNGMIVRLYELLREDWGSLGT